MALTALLDFPQMGQANDEMNEMGRNFWLQVNYSIQQYSPRQASAIVSKAFRVKFLVFSRRARQNANIALQRINNYILCVFTVWTS